MSFSCMHSETMRGSSERVNYICMNSRSVFLSWGGWVVGWAEERENVCNALISFSNLCVDVRKAWSPQTVVPPLLRAVIKAT